MKETTPISQESLTQFLGDPKAPEGHVYFINNEPIIQLDLFKDFYTLFWLGSLDVKVFSHYLSKIVNETEFVSSAFVVQCIISATRKDARNKRFITEETKFETEQKFLEPSLNVFYLQEQINRFTRPFATNIVALHTELHGEGENGELKLAMWSDTLLSPKKEKETGITSNLPLTTHLKSLLKDTSPAINNLSNSGFNDIIKLIKNDLENQGYA